MIWPQSGPWDQGAGDTGRACQPEEQGELGESWLLIHYRVGLDWGGGVERRK